MMWSAVVFSLIGYAHSFHASSHRSNSRQLIHRQPSIPTLLAKSENNQDEDDHDDAVSNIDIDDWRAFRAKLVSGQQDDGSGKASSSSSSWAYDSGKMIEQGSIILAKVDPDFCYFGLNQQYFHKSVMLVTYHNENDFTKGIILNRPTNLFLDDEDFLDDNGEPYFKTENRNSAELDNNSWRIWFGGDVRGLYADDSEGGTEIVCLHSIQTELARNVSEEILTNVFTTNYEGARKIVDANEASSGDFWVFAGYAGWTAGQLEDELNRESWYMISADSETVWNELTDQRDDDTLDPRNAGLKTWSTLMGMIGKQDEARAVSESFADLTLKEWAAESILFNSTLPIVNENDELDDLLKTLSPSISDSIDSAESFVDLAERYINDGLQGCVLRGSSKDRSPFLLQQQKLHKCSMLVIQDDEVLTVGVMLNHPMTKTHPIPLANGNDVEIPVRYGGSYGIPGIIEQPIIFLHNKSQLKTGVKIGEPVSKATEERDECMIWICSEQQVAKAIEDGRATSTDFMCVQGFQIWPKEGTTSNRGILAQLVTGDLEVVDEKNVEELWKVLSSQSQLSLNTLDKNFQTSLLAWSVGGKDCNSSPPFVYDSTVTTSQLADDSLRYWTEAFLLGRVVSAGVYDYSSGFE
jgi:putative transcriptional regulator